MTKEQILDAIKEMSVLELNDLVKAIEEEFGVTAAAPVAVVGGAAAGAAATAAAETPNFSSIAAINSTISVTDLEAIASMICSLVNDITINS